MRMFKGMMVNPKLVEDAFKAEPAWEDILSKIWKIDEQVEVQEYATFLRKLLNNQLSDMCTWWESRTGKKMSDEEKFLVFSKPKILSKMSALSKFIDYLEDIGKLQNQANSMGLGKFGPISNNKNCRAARNGGNKRAENMKEEKIKQKKDYQIRFDQYRKRAPNLSPNHIYTKIAQTIGKSVSHVRNVITGYQPCPCGEHA